MNNYTTSTPETVVAQRAVPNNGRDEARPSTAKDYFEDDIQDRKTIVQFEKNSTKAVSLAAEYLLND